MPHKGERCRKCGGRTKQVKFLDANPNTSKMGSVEHGWALFRCKSCKFEFKSPHGIHRVGASKTHWKYKTYPCPHCNGGKIHLRVTHLPTSFVPETWDCDKCGREFTVKDGVWESHAATDKEFFRLVKGRWKLLPKKETSA